MKILMIGAAGFAGAIARYALDGAVASRARGVFPWGTFVVNVTGCLLLGVLFAVLTERAAASPAVRQALTIGFVGAYTTFSTFALETVRLVEDGAPGAAAANVALSVIAGTVAAFAGVRLGRVL